MRIGYLIDQLQELENALGDVSVYIYDPATLAPYPVTSFYVDHVKEFDGVFYGEDSHNLLKEDTEYAKWRGYNVEVVDRGKCVVLDSSYIQ